MQGKTGISARKSGRGERFPPENGGQSRGGRYLDAGERLAVIVQAKDGRILGAAVQDER